MAQIEAATLITFNPPWIRAEQSLADALDGFCQWQITEIPVIDRDQQVLGVLQLGAVLALVAKDPSMMSGAAGENLSARPDPFQMQRFPRVALQQLLSAGYRMLPVVEDGRLIGTLSRADFLREFAISGLRLASAAVLDHAVSPGEPLEANATVDDAFALMDSERVDHVAIVQSGCPLAACTRVELDLAMQLAHADELTTQSTNHCRSVIQLIRPAPHLQPGQSMAEAAQTLYESGAMALLVVNKAKRILGMITESIILTSLLRSGA